VEQQAVDHFANDGDRALAYVNVSLRKMLGFQLTMLKIMPQMVRAVSPESIGTGIIAIVSQDVGS
jgi:hypothetical protein